MARMDTVRALIKATPFVVDSRCCKIARGYPILKAMESPMMATATPTKRYFATGSHQAPTGLAAPRFTSALALPIPRTQKKRIPAMAAPKGTR